MNRVQQLREAYHLAPHPEGGAFSEVYTAPTLAEGRSCAGSIYFLLEGADISHFHQIDCDELWYYHEGCGLRITCLTEAGEASVIELGPEVERGQTMMAVIPQGVIFSAENLDASSYSFLSCMTAPRFSYDGFRLVGLEEVRQLCPGRAEQLAYLAMEGI